MDCSIQIIQDCDTEHAGSLSWLTGSYELHLRFYTLISQNVCQEISVIICNFMLVQTHLVSILVVINGSMEKQTNKKTASILYITADPFARHIVTDTTLLNIHVKITGLVFWEKKNYFMFCYHL